MLNLTRAPKRTEYDLETGEPVAPELTPEQVAQLAAKAEFMLAFEAAMDRRRAAMYGKRDRRRAPRPRNTKQAALRRAFRGIVPRCEAWRLMLDGQAARRKARAS